MPGVETGPTQALSRQYRSRVPRKGPFWAGEMDGSRVLPLMMTASLSPLGSQTMECTSPPILQPTYRELRAACTKAGETQTTPMPLRLADDSLPGSLYTHPTAAPQIPQLAGLTTVHRPSVSLVVQLCSRQPCACLMGTEEHSWVMLAIYP